MKLNAFALLQILLATFLKYVLKYVLLIYIQANNKHCQNSSEDDKVNIVYIIHVCILRRKAFFQEEQFSFISNRAIIHYHFLFIKLLSLCQSSMNIFFVLFIHDC